MAGIPEESFGFFCSRLIAQERRDIRTLVMTAIDAAREDAPDGSGRRAMDEWLGARSDTSILHSIMEQGLENGMRLLNALDDHALAIELLLRSGQAPKLSLVTLQRGFIEALLLICHLFDPAVDPATLIRRHVAYQLQSVEGNEGTAVKFGGHLPASDLQRARTAVDEIQSFLLNNGFVLGKSRPNHLHTSYVGFEGANQTVAFNATDAMKLYLTEQAYEWSVSSGAVHALGWFLPSVVDGATEDALSDYVTTYTGVAAGMISASYALLNVFSGHSGIDVRAVEKATHFRVRAIISAHDGSAFSSIDVETFKGRRGFSPDSDESVLGAGFVRQPERWVRGR